MKNARNSCIEDLQITSLGRKLHFYIPPVEVTKPIVIVSQISLKQEAVLCEETVVNLLGISNGFLLYSF